MNKNEGNFMGRKHLSNEAFFWFIVCMVGSSVVVASVVAYIQKVYGFQVFMVFFIAAFALVEVAWWWWRYG